MGQSLFRCWSDLWSRRVAVHGVSQTIPFVPRQDTFRRTFRQNYAATRILFDAAISTCLVLVIEPH
jgi:hypothetical protein